MLLGDFTVGDTLYFKFTTRRFTTGAPFTLAGVPVLSAYEDDSVTQITAGFTLTADFDSVTGLNHVTLVASGANGFEAGKQYDIVITTGTVDSVSVVGEVVARFSLGRGAAFTRLGAPAGASVSADVAAVKVDTAATLADTGTDGVVVAAASKTGYALSAAGIQAIWDALTAALTTVGSIGKLIVDNLNAAITSRSSHSAADVWASVARTLTAATNITSTGGTTVPQTGDSFARIGVAGAGLTAIDLPNQTMDITGNITGNLSGAVGSVTGLTAADVGAIKAKTDSLTFTVAGQVDANIQAVNDVALLGDGNATPWGPV